MSESGISRFRFTPQARPVDTVGVDTSFQRMAGPSQRATNSLQPVMDRLPTPPEKSNNAAQLVEALSSFTKAVGSMTESYEKELIKVEGVNAEYDAQASSAKTWEEAVQQNPALAMKSPFYRKTFLARTAQNAMQARMSQLHADYFNSPLVNSTDPLAVNKWLQENLQGDLDKITDPDARAAALTFVRERSATFMKAHTDNATNNLVRKRQESFGASYGHHMDDAGTLPAAKAYEPGQVFAKDIPMEAQALLAGISAGESAGRYDVRYNGGKGATFDISQPHPNVREVITSGKHKGEYSSASGKYQFIYGTWVEANGGENKPMTQENQDRAAWAHAQKTYKTQTKGRDLLTDLKEQGLSQGIMRTLGGQWEALGKGGREDLARYAATYNVTMKSGGGVVPDAAAGKDPNFDSFAEKMWDTHKAQVAGGETVAAADKSLLTQLSNRVMDTGDVTFFDILRRPQEGRPALAEIPEYRTMIRTVSNQAMQLKVERQNAQVRVEAAAKKAAMEKVSSELLYGAAKNIEEGKPPHYDWKTIQKASRVDADLGEKLIRQNKLWDEIGVREEPVDVNRLWTEIYNGRGSPALIQQAHLDGLIKNPQTYKSMLDEVGSQRKQDWMGQPVWRDAMDGLNGFFRDNGEDKPEMAAKAHNARSLLKKSFGDWMARDPNRATDFAAQRQFLDQTITAIVPEIRKQTFNGEATIGSAYGTPKAGPSATTPTPGAKPASSTQTAQAVVPAGPGASWQTQKMFADYGNLQTAIAEWRSSKGAQTAALSQMASKLGLKSPQEILRFVEAQGKLFIANPTGN